MSDNDPAVSNGRGIGIIVNPSAGLSQSDEVIDRLRSEFSAAESLTVRDDAPLDQLLARSENAAVLARC